LTENDINLFHGVPLLHDITQVFAFFINCLNDMNGFNADLLCITI